MSKLNDWNFIQYIISNIKARQLYIFKEKTAKIPEKKIWLNSAFVPIRFVTF